MTLAILLLTYERTAYALRTIDGIRRNLRTTEPIKWYVADDGSSQAHFETVLSRFAAHELIGQHTDRAGYGANVNRAYSFIKREADITLFLEDDWELQSELNIDPFISLLNERQEFGMVRLGYLNLWMRGYCFGHAGRLHWHLDRNADAYVLTGHPSLRHRRMWDAYGPYPEGLNPGETELGYALQFRNKESGPDVTFPAMLGEYGPFGHVGEVKSY